MPRSVRINYHHLGLRHDAGTATRHQTPGPSTRPSLCECLYLYRVENLMQDMASTTQPESSPASATAPLDARLPPPRGTSTAAAPPLPSSTAPPSAQAQAEAQVSAGIVHAQATNPLPHTTAPQFLPVGAVGAPVGMTAPYYRYYAGSGGGGGVAPLSHAGQMPQHPHAGHPAHPHAPQVPQLTYMEGQLTTQAMLVEQQRRIKQLEAELVATRAEVARLHAQARARPGAADAPVTEEKKPSSRYWTPDEHKRFLEGLELFGPRDIKAISRHVGTRTPTQVRTHSQKYWQRVERERKKAAEATGAGGAAAPGATDTAKLKQPTQSIEPKAIRESKATNPSQTQAPPPAQPPPPPPPPSVSNAASSIDHPSTAVTTSPRKRSTRPRTRTAAAQAAIAAERPNGTGANGQGNTNTNTNGVNSSGSGSAENDGDNGTRKRAHDNDGYDDDRRVKPRAERVDSTSASAPAPPPPGAGGLLRVPSTSALPSSEGGALPASESIGGGGALPSSELPPPMLTSVPSAGTLAGLLPLVASSSAMGLTSVPSLSALPHVPSLGALVSLPRVSSATGLPSLPRVASSLTAVWKGAEAALQPDRLPPRPNAMQRSDSNANLPGASSAPAVSGPLSGTGTLGAFGGTLGGSLGGKTTNMPRTNSILSLLSGLPTAAMNEVNEDLDDATAMALHDPKWSAESS